MKKSELKTIIKEIGLGTTGGREFIQQITSDPQYLQDLGFSTLKELIRYIQDNGVEAWNELRREFSNIKK